MRLRALVLLLAFAHCSRAQDRPPGTNRLIHESSPYLLLHARNPVDWYPWGDEAIELARRLDRPIFLSIGYSTCYWCHRMEEDVFEDPEIAALMNEAFVNVKVDREERPDLDEIYMSAAQLLTRGGGWPNNLFLTPDLKPFFAGTYFPPEDREGAVGFPTVLRRIQEMWKTDRAKIEQAAEDVATSLEAWASAREAAPADIPGASASTAALDALARSFDEEWGGFGAAPKFPSPASLRLLHSHAARGNGEALRMLRVTLHRMGEGALYDHLGGGFHRYATDREWRIPHFEKMLYDNAALAEVLADACELEPDPELERLARGTLDFVLEKLTHEDGGLLSAIDAQTGGREGAYYVWSREEIERVLSSEEAALISALFGLEGKPNFEERSYTLYLTAPLGVQAERRGLSREELLARIAPALAKLRKAREARPFPLVDDKVLTDWNGLMIAAAARAGSVFGEPRYLGAAERGAAFVLERLRGDDGRLLHLWRAGEARVDAFLEDYAFLARGLVLLHRATGGKRWLEEAERLMEEMEERLRDPRGGYYQSRAKPHLLVQTKGANDGASLSGNGVAASVLLDLHELTGNPVYLSRAADAIRSFSSALERYPEAAATLALAAERYHSRGPVEVRVETGPGASPGWRGLRVVLGIREGWHVNANPASSRFAIPTEVRGDVRGFVYPPGRSSTFAFSDEPLSVYEGEIVLEGEARSGAASVKLVYQACDDTRCLAPVETTLPIEPR